MLNEARCRHAGGRPDTCQGRQLQLRLHYGLLSPFTHGKLSSIVRLLVLRRTLHLVAFKMTPLEPQAGADAPLPPRRHLGLLLLHPLPCEVPAFEATMSVMGPCKVRCCSNYSMV